jgi:hypothetical protein
VPGELQPDAAQVRQVHEKCAFILSPMHCSSTIR